MTTVTAKKLLVDAVTSFMEGEGFSCGHTKTAVVQSVVALARYQEEGRPLFPQVFICDDLRQMTGVILGTDVIQLGTGSLQPETVKKGLKQCAPLAQGAWSVYIERNDHAFHYGLFRLPSLPLALSPVQGIVNAGARIVIAQQVAENVVELAGSTGAMLRVHLNDSDESEPAPSVAIDDLCNSIVGDLAEGDDKTTTRAFLLKTLARALQTGHGCLIGVVDHSKEVPEYLSDGVLLKEPVDIASRVGMHSKEKTADTAFALQSAATLLRGMLDSDGITLLDTKARIRGFRIFVKYSDGDATATSGGGRRRAFHKLCNHTNGVKSGLYRSQDGNTQYREGTV